MVYGDKSLLWFVDAIDDSSIYAAFLLPILFIYLLLLQANKCNFGLTIFLIKCPTTLFCLH